MRELLLIFLTALALGVGGTVTARRIALRRNVVDEPGGHKGHGAPVPLLGGVAMCASVLVSLLLFGDQYYVLELAGILVGAFLMLFLGLWDDYRPLSPIVKFSGQLVVTTALIVSGVQVALFGNDVLNILITALWILYVTNALNLLDNMDGLAAGIAAIASGFFVLCSILNGQYLVGTLSAAMLGGSLGFLYFNFNPASIFMGDAGSLFVGFVMAALGIKLRFPSNVDWVTWMVPVLILGVPIFDTALVTLSRLRRGGPIWKGGQDHVSHRLRSLGWPTRKVVLALYLAGGAVGLTGTLLSLLEPGPAYTVGAIVLVCAVWLGLRLEQKHFARSE